MRKISGILPSSPRLRTVDVKNSQPMRSGVPTFGARTAQSDPKDRLTMSSVDRAMMNDKLKAYRPRDIFGSKIANQVANDFFLSELPQFHSEVGLSEKIELSTGAPPKYEASYYSSVSQPDSMEKAYGLPAFSDESDLVPASVEPELPASEKYALPAFAEDDSVPVSAQSYEPKSVEEKHELPAFHVEA
jgi:hypothetical protein